MGDRWDRKGDQKYALNDRYFLKIFHFNVRIKCNFARQEPGFHLHE